MISLSVWRGSSVMIAKLADEQKRAHQVQGRHHWAVVRPWRLSFKQPAVNVLYCAVAPEGYYTSFSNTKDNKQRERLQNDYWEGNLSCNYAIILQEQLRLYCALVVKPHNNQSFYENCQTYCS